MFNSHAAAAVSGSDPGYQVPGSVWTDGAADYLSRTVTTSTTFTFSAWVRRLSLGSIQGILESGCQFNANNTITAFGLTTTAVFRDTTAAYHIHVSDNGLFINGVSFGAVTTSALTNPDIGRSSTNYLKAVLSEVALVDGTSVAATSFGEFDSYGVWRPKNLAGLTWGAKGFHLDFADSADLGNDVSGNGNDWTLNSITSANASTDVPSDPQSQWNALVLEDLVTSYSVENRQVSGGGAASGTIPVLNKGYFEFAPIDGTFQGMGFARIGTGSRYSGAGPTEGSAVYSSDGRIWLDGVLDGTYSTYTTTDRMSATFDPDTRVVVFRKNDSIERTLGAMGGTFDVSPYYTANSGADGIIYTQEVDWTYTPPTGFLAISLANLPEHAIKDGSAHFDVLKYTGDGVAIGSGGLAVTGLEFTPDHVVIKNRDATDQWMVFDIVRGVTKYLSWDGTDVEVTDAETLASFDDGGFTVGNNLAVNTSSENYVAYCWKYGGAGSSNTDGTINTTTTSVNATAGCSIGTYTGNAIAGATVGHGLGVAPELIIVKERADDVGSWYVYHASNTAAPETDYLALDTTAATADLNTTWNDTAPTSSVFSLGDHDDVNAADTYVYECHVSIPGYSKVGSYTGNANADGPYIDCGFTPKFILIKTVGVESWRIYDTARQTYNVQNNILFPNDPSADIANASYNFDILANGFKIRSADKGINSSGITYIYYSVGSYPSGGANTTPAPGR